MSQYLLFIDTEGSGLPRRWNEPYSKENNWPHAVQVSWVIYTEQGTEVKREDFYIKNDDFEISKGSIKIHGITNDVLAKKGKSREEALKRLSADLNTYKPLVIGHFIELDFHVLAADFYRAGMENPIKKLGLPVFCTMLASTKYVRNPQSTFLKLGQLFETLFAKELTDPHNAIYDAKATADCFFEMRSRGDITTDSIAHQKIDLTIKPKSKKLASLIFFTFVFLLVIFIVFEYEF